MFYSFRFVASHGPLETLNLDSAVLTRSDEREWVQFYNLLSQKSNRQGSCHEVEE